MLIFVLQQQNVYTTTPLFPSHNRVAISSKLQTVKLKMTPNIPINTQTHLLCQRSTPNKTYIVQCNEKAFRMTSTLHRRNHALFPLQLPYLWPLPPKETSGQFVNQCNFTLWCSNANHRKCGCREDVCRSS